ncbi:AraC family transcriptional regulator [Shewanella sp. Isolate8]|uniref:helix-turn-helix transcriptional regulator n=1 Tax=Shewanella sp. Isolate8 TaxID=2908529 RepID=UPI001EFD565F|nr:AraC family transcriptional regulator [Shewanella sp. Isolate8]MCG9746919.1 AraC family transcriptional regulator [Shewanella sp. Isolate8]
MTSNTRYQATLKVGDQSYPAYELRSLVHFLAERYGKHHAEQLCQEIGLGLNELARLNFVYVWQVDYAMAFLGNLADDPQIGARLGETYKVEELALIWPYLAKCQTLGECLEFVIAHPELVGSVSDTLVSHGERCLYFRWLNTAKISARYFSLQFQNSVCSMLALARQLTGQMVTLKRVLLATPAHDSEFLAGFCRAEVSFNHEFFEWAISHEMLSLPVVYDFSLLQLDEQALHDTSLIEKVLAILNQDFPNNPKLESMALRLNMSDRTLRRHLASAGTSYQKLVDQVRCQTAIGLIVQGDKSIVDIADIMGFGDVSHFRQSFKHWLGLPPGQFIRKI